MGSVRTEIVIKRPPSEVFAYVTDLRHDVRWYRGIEAVRVLSNVEIGAGATYEQQTRMFGRRWTAVLEVTDYLPPRGMTLVARKSLIPFTAVYSFEPLSAGRATRYVLDAQVAGNGVFRALGPVLAPLLRRATQSRMTELKRQLEAARS